MLDSCVEWTHKAYQDAVELATKPRFLMHQILSVGTVLFTALMLWRFIMLVTGSPSPVVVVLSGSMEPGYYRGDVLILSMPQRVNVGDVVVFQTEGREIPIVHRVIGLHENEGGDISVLTKGDNNNLDDRALYPDGMKWINYRHLLGVVNGYIPFVGMLTIWLNDHPWLKYGTICCMVILVFFNKE